MFKHWEKLKIKSKIMLSLIMISGFVAFSFCLILIFTTINLAKFSAKSNIESGNLSYENSKIHLTEQAEQYVEQISKNLSDIGNSLLTEVQHQTVSLSIAVTDVYESDSKSGVPPLPENTPKINSSERELACEKAFMFQKTNEAEEELKVLSGTKNIVKSLYLGNSSVKNVYIGTKNGVFYRFTHNNNPVRFDPRQRDWYMQAVESPENAVWQSSYVDQIENELCITCSKAIMNSNGEIIAVVGIDMYLEDINKYVIETKIGETGFCFVINKNGEIIMHPEYKINMDSFKSAPLSDENIHESYKNLLQNVKEGKSGIQKSEINNKNFYVGYAQMSTTGWSLAVATEIEEITQPALILKNKIDVIAEDTNVLIHSYLIEILVFSVMIFAVFGILIYILSTKFSKVITKPIEKLKDEAGKIGNGDFTVKIETASKDEIGKLGESFNKMANDLRTYMENLKKETTEKQKIHSELEIARKIQKSMIPSIFPAFPNRKEFDVYALMDPAKEVGGDFYDFFFVDDEHLALVVADVSGKGISAALFMVIAKILLKNELQEGKLPSEVLEVVNNKLCENNEASMFVTTFLAVVNINTGETCFSNAGHLPPLILKEKKGEYMEITKRHGSVLGAIRDLKFKNENLTLKKNDIIFMYTDGITEAMNSNFELFSEEKLETILDDEEHKGISLENLVKVIRKEINIFTKEAERSDDITMLGFKKLNEDKN